MPDETIKVNVEGNADKKLDDIGNSAKKSAASVEGMGTAFKFIAAFAAIEKIKQMYTAYVASGVKGSEELKAAVGEVEGALIKLAETKTFRELIGAVSYVMQEAAKATQLAAEGNANYDRSIQNSYVWLSRFVVVLNSYIGKWEIQEKVKKRSIEAEDELSDALRETIKQETERQKAIEKAARVSKQRNEIEKERFKIQLDMEASQKREEIANAKTVAQINAIKKAINDEIDTRSKADDLSTDHQTRLLGLLRQAEEQTRKLEKAEADRGKALIERSEKIRKAEESIAKAIESANKAALQGVDEFLELATTIHEVNSKRVWKQIELNNLLNAENKTLEQQEKIQEQQTKLQEEINELAAKENLLRQSKMENLKAIAEIEKEIAKTLQDAGEIPDAMADRLNNADKIRNAIDEQLKTVRNLVAASKNQNIQEDERKKLVEQARKEQEKLVTLLAHREKFAKGMVEQMGRLKQQAEEAAKALDDAFRDRTKQQGNEQQLDPRNMLNDRQRQKLQNDIRNQARRDARAQAQAVDEVTADDINDMKNRGANADEIAKRQRQGNLARRKIFRDLNRGEGEAVRNAVVEQTQKAVGGVIRNEQDRQQIDAQEARILEVQTERLLELEKGNAIMKQRLDAIEEANRRAAMPNFRRAGRLN